MDRGPWRATVHRVSKSQTYVMSLSMYACQELPYMYQWHLKFVNFLSEFCYNLFCVYITSGLFLSNINKKILVIEQ